MSAILTDGKSPEDWAAAFAARGIRLSPRKLRADARRLGACIVYGKAMILLPDHLDRILAGAATPAAAQKPRIKPMPAVVDPTAKALAHLKRCRKGR